MLKKLKNLYPHQTLMSIFIIGLFTIVASFIVQYLFKVMPCEMCYWQRYLVIAITVVAFIGTLFRGVIKKKFLFVISMLAFVSMGIAIWQSLAQANLIELAEVCQGPAMTKADQITDGSAILEALKANEIGYVDCSKPEDFFLYNMTGITLANANAVLMLLIGVFAFYKLFFKPKRRFRKYNNYNRNRNRNNNGNRRYRGSGYRRSHNRNRKPNSNYRNNNSYNNKNSNES
ncbi:MAG: disulfide bond formation protein B [Proteobacteria bacterium]|nr:disulfide bond formation protein B [Pseudomonadota bacterium]